LGCDDFVVDVRRVATSVERSRRDRAPVVFDAEYYDQQVSILVTDHTWEPIGTTVERHLAAMFSGKLTDDVYGYD
jgi:hypothetical protein